MAGASSSPNWPKSTISPSSISGGRNSFRSIFAEARAEEKISIGGMVEDAAVVAEAVVVVMDPVYFDGAESEMVDVKEAVVMAALGVALEP